MLNKCYHARTLVCALWLLGSLQFCNRICYIGGMVRDRVRAMEGVKVEKRFGIFLFYLVVIQTHICIVLLCYFVECVFTYILMETVLGKVHRNIYKKKQLPIKWNLKLFISLKLFQFCGMRGQSKYIAYTFHIISIINSQCIDTHFTLLVCLLCAIVS